MIHRPAALAGVAAVAVTLALTTVSPASANGSGAFVDAGDYVWYVGAGAGEWGIQLGYYAGDDFGALSNLQNSQFVLLDPASDASIPFACSGVTVTEGTDDVVACTDVVTTPWGFSATSAARILAPGDLLRLDFVVTNVTTAPVRLDYSYNSDWGSIDSLVGSSAPTTVDAPPSGLSSDDVWAYITGAEGTTPSGLAWGRAGAASSQQPDFGGDEISIVADGSGALVAPGETVVVSFFSKLVRPDVLVRGDVLVPGVTEASPAADALPQPAASPTSAPVTDIMAEFAVFDGRLTRGLPANATVVNWQPVESGVTSDDGPELADTGVDAIAASAIGLLALVLVTVGAGFVTRRRAVSPRV